MPGLFACLRKSVWRELLLAWKRPGDVLNPLFFFAMVCTLYPLAVGPSPEQLEFSGPAVVWVAALLASLLALQSLYVSDFEDGSLEQMLVSPQPLVIVVFAKSIAHWLTSGLPLVFFSPLFAMMFHMDFAAIVPLVATLSLGTICLSLLGSVGAALTVGLHRSTALLSLLILPLAMPVLIFGARTVSLAVAGDAYTAGIFFLAAYAVLTLTLTPYATAAALRISNQ